MVDDILHQARIANGNFDMQATNEIYNEGLIVIDDICAFIANKALEQLGMVASNRPMHEAYNQAMAIEQNYDRE